MSLAEVLKTYTLKELREMVAASNIKAFSELAKPKLIESMITHPANFSRIQMKPKIGMTALPSNIAELPKRTGIYKDFTLAELARRNKLKKSNPEYLPLYAKEINGKRINGVIWDKKTEEGMAEYLFYYKFYPAAFINLKDGREKNALHYFVYEANFDESIEIDKSTGKAKKLKIGRGKDLDLSKEEYPTFSPVSAFSVLIKRDYQGQLEELQTKYDELLDITQRLRAGSQMIQEFLIEGGPHTGFNLGKDNLNIDDDIVPLLREVDKQFGNYKRFVNIKIGGKVIPSISQWEDSRK